MRVTASLSRMGLSEFLLGFLGARLAGREKQKLILVSTKKGKSATYLFGHVCHAWAAVPFLCTDRSAWWESLAYRGVLQSGFAGKVAECKSLSLYLHVIICVLTACFLHLPANHAYGIRTGTHPLNSKEDLML